MHTHTHAYTYTHTCTCTHAHAHTHTHTHSHTHMQAYIHTGEKVYQVPTQAPTFSVAWHPKRYLLAYACDDKACDYNVAQ